MFTHIDQELEAFWEQTLVEPLQPIPDVGEIIVDPSYGTDFNRDGGPALREQLSRCVRSKRFEAADMQSPQGVRISDFRNYPLLARYAKAIILRRESTGGAWVQVLPPGNPKN